MAQVVLFHHALGVTGGMRAFADDLRAGGHEVTVATCSMARRSTTSRTASRTKRSSAGTR